MTNNINIVKSVLQKLGINSSTKYKEEENSTIFYIKCKAHKDTKPSLSVKLCKFKNTYYYILLHCFAGCSFKDLINAFGINEEEQIVFNTKKINEEAKIGANNSSLESNNYNSIYTYTNEKGERLYAVIKTVLEDGSKEYSIKYFTNNKNKELYNLSRVNELIKNGVIFICEGEKDADNLQKFLDENNYIAFCTTNVAGALNWTDYYTCFLIKKLNEQKINDAAIFVATDLDYVGQQRYYKIKESFLKYKSILNIKHLHIININTTILFNCASLHYKELELPKKFKDITDFIEYISFYNKNNYKQIDGFKIFNKVKKCCYLFEQNYPRYMQFFYCNYSCKYYSVCKMLYNAVNIYNINKIITEIKKECYNAELYYGILNLIKNCNSLLLSILTYTYYTPNEDIFYINTNILFLINKNREEFTHERYIKVKGSFLEKVFSTFTNDKEIIKQLLKYIMLKNVVDAAQTIAFKEAGIVKIGNKVILNEEGIMLLPYKYTNNVENLLIVQYLKTMLKEEQYIHFINYLSALVKSIYNGAINKNLQVIFFVGPPGVGKSALQMLITKLVGGRSYKIFNFLVGRDNFNASALGAEHWYLEDEYGKDIRDREALKQALINVVANNLKSFRGMHKEAIMVQTRHIVTASVNYSNINSLPFLTEDNVDKFIIYHCYEGAEELLSKFYNKFEDELPYFIFYLLFREEDENYSDKRYIVKPYYNKNILDLFTDNTVTAHLQALLIKNMHNLLEKQEIEAIERGHEVIKKYELDELYNKIGVANLSTINIKNKIVFGRQLSLLCSLQKEIYKKCNTNYATYTINFTLLIKNTADNITALTREIKNAIIKKEEEKEKQYKCIQLE